MADVQIARCDGGKFNSDDGVFNRDNDECGRTLELLVLSPNNNFKQTQHFLANGWVRREFRSGYETDATAVWWSFCPDHTLKAVEQYYLARFSDDGE